MEFAPCSCIVIQQCVLTMHCKVAIKQSRSRSHRIVYTLLSFFHSFFLSSTLQPMSHSTIHVQLQVLRSKHSQEFLYEGGSFELCFEHNCNLISLSSCSFLQESLRGYALVLGCHMHSRCTYARMTHELQMCGWHHACKEFKKSINENIILKLRDFCNNY